MALSATRIERLFALRADTFLESSSLMFPTVTD